MSQTAHATYSRVTIVNGSRHIDLALPTTIPLSEVMPQLLRLCHPQEAPQAPAAWTLGRLGGNNLSLAQSIGDAAVADGEVLELRSTAAAHHPAQVEDVRDTIEDAIDESGRQWQPRTTVEFAVHLAALGLAVAILLPEARRPGDPLALVLAAIVAALTLCGGWWVDRRGYHVAAWALLTTATLWGGTAGWLASLFAGWPWPASLAGALTAALVIAALARAATPTATAQLAATAVLCAAAVPAGVFALTGSDPTDAVRIVVVLTILVIGVLPRVSLTVGGIASADYRIRNIGSVDSRQLTRRVRHSDLLLRGGLVSVAAVGAVTGLILTTSDLWWDRSLGLAAGLGLVLRSRVFSRVPHILALRLSGVIVLIGQILVYLRGNAAGAWVVAAAMAAATTLVMVSAIRLSEVARARVKQLLNLAEIVVVAAMIPLAAGGLGLYDRMGTLIQ